MKYETLAILMQVLIFHNYFINSSTVHFALSLYVGYKAET